MSTVVPFDGELDAPAPAAAPTTTPTVAAKVVPFDGELDAPAAPSQAGAGRGMVNPPLATEPQPERVNTRDVGLGEGMYRDMRLGQSGMSKTVGLALASIPAMAEEVWSSTLEDYFGHDKQTGVTDAAMGSLVQPSDQQLQANEFKPGEQRSVGNRVAGALTRMITVDLPAMLASGGETAPATLARGAQPVVQVLRESLEHGLKASQPVMINAATEKADQVLKAGGDEKQAVISGLTAAMSTAVQNSVALSVPGKVFSRVAGGGIVGSAMGEGSRVIQNIADPEKLHREFDPGEAAVSAATGAVLSGVMGERSSPRPLDRIDLGYDPLTAKKPVDEAVQGMGEGASMYRGPEPGVAQPAREGVDAIFKAGSVEEAAAAASRVVREGVDAGVDTELNKLRPLRPSTEGAPDVSAADAVPGVPAGADRLGGDDAAAGVVPPAGDRGADGRAVDAAGDRDGAAPVAAPVGAERALELKTRPYNEGERAQAESAIASLNAGLERSNADRIASKVGAPDEPAQVLQSAPTGDMVRARQVARLFGLPVTFIEPHARFNGVHIEGQIFISPQEKHPVLAVMGHEVLHGVMSKLGGEQAQALRDRIAPFLRPEAVQARLQAEPHRGREHATEEAIADLNGSMWMDPKFWQAVREQDPHAFRQLAYRFMELAATVHQKLGKVSRFQAEKFTTDVDTVRRILAEQHAMLAKEEGVERLSPNEKAEFGVRKEKPAEPAKFDRTEGEEPAVERRRVARNAPEPREMPADHEVEMAPRVDAALRRWAKGQGDDRDLAAAIQRDGQRVPGARMLENTQGTVADETPSFDRDKDTTPFYSALARGVEAIPSKAQGADGWRAQVKGLVNKGLVKQDEIEWTGLDDWLKLQPGKVSKEQVLEYLKANGVKVEEVQKGGEEGTSRFDQVVVDASALGYTFDGQGVDTTLVDRSGKVWQYDNLLDAFIPHGPEAESDNPPKLTGRIAELADEYVKISDDDPYADRPEAQTRYSQYTLPGGENYREVLLTLPTDSRGADESMIDRLNQRLVAKGMDGLAEDQRAALQRGGNDAMNMLDDLNQRVGIRTEDVARAMANGDPDKQYRSSHWDEPNILAHIRLNDRNSTDPLTEQQQADIGKRAQMQKRADELAHKIGKASRDGRIAGDIRREELLKELRPLVRAGKMTPAEMMRRLDDAAFSTATDDVMAMQRERDALLSSMPPEPKQKSSRVLFVEEIQSDWAQQGRKQGFRRDAEGLTPEEESRFQKLLETGRSNLTGDARSEFNALLQRRDGAAESKAAVPRAPFVEKTDAWVNLALKRVIKMAVDEGYDKVAFVTGEQSADRYGLEKQISRVEFQDNHTLGVGKADLAGPASRGILHAYDLNGRRVIDRPIDNAAKELPELIGEEVTQKLLSATPVSERTAGGNESRIRRLQGVDLKVGGEGMKSFYDKIIPSALGKLLPKLGGGNLAEVRIGKTEAKAEIDRKSMREDLRELAKHDIGYDEFRERHGLDASMVSDEELEAIDDRDPHNRSRVGPVITGLIDTIAGRVAAGKAMKQTGFDVTPAMKEKAGPGLPLFSRKAEEGKVDKLQMVAKRAQAKAAARVELASLERTVDRYTGGLSTQMSAGTQGVDYVPTNADMARLGDRVRQAIYEADDGVTVLASKALSTEGRYGDPERSLDLEVVAREGYDPTTLWRQMLHEAQAAKQDSTFLSRVLREGEAVDPLVHRPGVEIYLREGASGEQLQSMLDELAKHGAQYLTVVVDGRRSGQSMGGEMPPAVGVRIQYVPEFEQRYGMENLLPMQDVSLAAKMQAKAADLAELADLVSGKVEGVSHAHQYWYETQVAFGHQYRELLNGIATGSSEGIAGAAAGGGNWRGQSVREGLASADRQSGKAALEQPARADDAVGRDATRTAPVAEPSFSREENEQRRGAGLPTREVQVNGQWRPIEDSTGRIIGQGDFLKQQAFYKWFKDSPFADATGRPLLVHRTAAVDAALSGKPTRLEGAPDGLRSDAELLANLLEGSAFRAHGLSDLDAPTQRVVLATVRDLSHDAEILGSVVRLLPVRVVDLLAREKLAPEDLLRNDAMLRKFLSVDDDRPIAARVDVANTLVRAVADVATERARSLSGVAPTGAEVGSALGTNVGYLAIGGDGHTLEFKSAVNGGESSTNPDIRFARATAVPAGLPAAAPSSRWERSKAVVSDLIDEGLARSGVYRLTAPMSEGTARAKAVAQNFANAERRARDEWNSVASYIEKNFDQAQREKMWNAADEENDILAGREPRTASNGLAALDTKQRALVNRLHIYGEELLQRARDVGMFNGEGVPYWTPRMMVMLDQAGEFQRPQDTTPGKKATSGGEGRNVFTSSSNLKQRKYLSSSETAAAMQAKGGELVRDIYTMPMAMARLERAIAGRELINQIKELGRATGQTLVSTGRPDHEGFFTLDHGSFTTWQPRFEKDAAGKMKVVMSENGEPVFDRVPLYMSKEFEGPVRAILTQQDGPLYRAFMLLKSKAMSAIMFSPLIHNMVIFGRALGYDPTFAGTAALYVKGYAAKQDRDLVRSAIDHGMVPMGQNKNGMMDITDVARGFGREGGPLDPNESLVAHGAGALAGLISKKLGAKVKGGIDAAGDFWHGTLLWNRIGDLQMGIFQHARDRLVGQGFSDNVASTMAAHWANRYAGAVGRENMSAIARKTANVMLFSRSFNMGNVGTIKDMFYGMPEGLRGKILHEATPDQAKQAFTEARRKAVGAFVADTALALIGLAVAQSAVDKLKKDKSWEEIFGGYTERAGRMWEEVKRHPATPTSYNPLQISPTFDNEPGKQERVDYGEIPGQGARHQYMRLPTGKVVEDLFNWMLHPAETFSSKMSPLAKAVWQVIQNDKGFDVPVMDPNSSAGAAALQAAAHLAKAQVPWDTIVTMWDKLHGKTTPIENDKLVGQMTGFTWSQGHPGGPEAGVYAQTEERIKQQRLYAMEEVKRLLRYDQEDKARERLEEIGLTPKEVTSILKRLEKPKEGMGREQRRKFNQHSGEEDQRRMESVTR